MKIRKFLDVIIISVLAFSVILFALLERENPSQNNLPAWFLPISLGLIFVFPGYVLTKALLPSLDKATVLLLSVSLSVVLDIVGIFILNALPGGLIPMNWAFWLGGITLLGSLAVVLKRFYSPELNHSNALNFKINWRVWSPFLVALSITLVSIFVARTSFIRSGTTFTQLWILPTSSKAPYTFEIGIRNYERQERKYDLSVESRGRLIYSESGIEVAPNGTWSVILSLEEKPIRPISVYLYRSDAPDVVYRTVELAPIAFDGPLPPAKVQP